MNKWLHGIGLATIAAMLVPLGATPALASGYTPQPGYNLIVKKVSVFGNANFSFKGDLGTFSIQTGFGEGQKAFQVPAGTYHVTEEALAGWTQVSNGCKAVYVPAYPVKPVVCEIVNMMMMGGTVTPNLKVHILKYLDGAKATAVSADGYLFPMRAQWSAANIGAGSGNYVLGNSHGGAADLYGADTADMSPGAFYTTWEITTDLDPTSKVLKVGEPCSPGKFVLLGYSVSTTSFADAATQPILPAPFVFNNLTSDRYIIVHNKKCLSPGWLKVIKLTTSGDGTFTFGGWDVDHFSITTTGGFGYKVIALQPGNYEIEEVDLPGWAELSSECEWVTIQSGQTTTCTIINKKAGYYGEIRGKKCQDVNGDGSLADCKPLAGWTIYLDTNQNGKLDGSEPSTVTNALGRYRFQNLPPGTYLVREVLKPGWIQTFPASGKHWVKVHPGQVVKGRHFGNLRCDLGSIGGTKYHDLNCNGRRDPGEPALANWTITLKKPGGGTESTTTDTNGHYTFDNLAPGSYIVREVQKHGWIQTTPDPPAILVTWGTDRDDINFGNRRLW